MRNKIVEIADEQGLTGLKRIGYFVIAPVVAGVAFVIGYAKGVARSLKKSA